MAIQKTEAIVFDRRDFRETSYIITFFSNDFGKIITQAKGAKRKVDKFGTNFLPFSYNKIVFYEKNNSDLHIISQADLIENFDNIEDSVEKFSYASYFLELVNATMPDHEPNRAVFKLLTEFLHFLNNAHTISNIKQVFEIKFLKFSGFKPQLDCCVNCARPIENNCKFSYVLGGILCQDCFSEDASAYNILKGTIASLTYIEKIDINKINNFKMLNNVRQELEKILKNFIAFHLAHQFNSLEFIKKVKFAYV